MKGRPRKPLAQRAQEGDRRKIGRKKLEAQIAAEPRTQSGLPEPPAHINGLAREAWDAWKIQLELMGLDKMPDAAMLEGACVAYQRAVIADEEVKRDGILLKVYKEVEGEMFVTGIKTNPACRVSAEAWKQVKAFCTEFGFSPASRARLAVQKTEVTSKDDLVKALMADDPPAATVQ